MRVNEIIFDVILMTFTIRNTNWPPVPFCILYSSRFRYIDTFFFFLGGGVTVPSAPVSYAYYSKWPTAANLD